MLIAQYTSVLVAEYSDDDPTAYEQNIMNFRVQNMDTSIIQNRGKHNQCITTAYERLRVPDSNSLKMFVMKDSIVWLGSVNEIAKLTVTVG